jgi:hypothetical protein
MKAYASFLLLVALLDQNPFRDMPSIAKLKVYMQVLLEGTWEDSTQQNRK